MESLLAPSWIFSYLQILGIHHRHGKRWKLYQITLLITLIAFLACGFALLVSDTSTGATTKTAGIIECEHPL
jgi:hypothetical protein